MMEKETGPMVRKNSKGFGTIEVLASLFVIVIALTSLLVLYGYSIATITLSQDLLIAKQKSREALESIFTARNTQQITFDMIQNVSDSGIFLDGFQPLRRPNPTAGSGDGLTGTADDGEIEALTLPGPDGVLGNGDDEIRVLDSFERRIQIDPVLYSDSTVNPDVRRVTVTIQYSTPLGGQRTYDVESYISRFR
ncbi:hypothetical protein MYX65_09125 [Acidobacteria bacterium AH-259-L09]|nr:hypothetical protein [Acidobacteria bacterium AH-259-L09]